MAVPQTSPSPWAAWVSPTLKSAPLHLHWEVEDGARGEVADIEVAAHPPGRDDRVMARLRGPLTPDRAAKGFRARAPAAPSAGASCRGRRPRHERGVRDWSPGGRRPNVWPSSPSPAPPAPGGETSMVTLIASPARAPSTKIGPETGLILPKSSPVRHSRACSTGPRLARRGVVAVEQDGRAGQDPLGRGQASCPSRSGAAARGSCSHRPCTSDHSVT
jgi:hypothetical protein